MFLERPRLDVRIRRALANGLVVLQAPLGFGKTVALRSALRDSATPIAWYDAAPWHENAFALALVAAMSTVRSGFGRDTRAISHTGASPQALARAFVGDIARLSSPTILAIDDAVDLYDTPTFGAFVDELITIRPAQLLLALASRSIRLGQHPAAVTADELRFTREEIGNSLPETTGDATIQRVAESTGGWPAAVSLALRDSAPMSSLGARASDRLDAASRELAQSLAVATSIDLQQFGRHDRATLERLLADGIVVDAGGGAFELQPLVRTSLIEGMLARDDGSLADAHLAAGNRAEAHGAFGAALYHFDAARRSEPLLEFLHRHLELVELAGALPLMIRAVEWLRRAGVEDAALFAFIDALSEHARGGDRAGERFERAAEIAERLGQLRIAFAAGARAAETALADGRRIDPARLAALQGSGERIGPIARQTAGVLHAWQEVIDGNFEAAIEIVDRFSEVTGGRAGSGLTIVRAYAETSLGRIGSARRQLDDLTAVLEGSDQVVLYVQASIWYARLALLWGDTAAALDYAQQAQRVAHRLDLETESASMYAALAEASAHAGDAAATLRWAQELRRHAQTAWYGVDRRRLGAIADQHVARALFLRGDVAQAIELASNAAAEAPPVQQYVLLSDAASYAYARGDSSLRAKIGIQPPAPNDAADAVALAGAIALLEAIDVAAGESHERIAAPSLYSALLRQRDGSVRLPMVAQTLRKVFDEPGNRGEFIGAIDLYCERGPRFETAILQAFAAHRKLDASAATPAALQEPLTEREAEVLALLAAGLTNKEIAERLVVSPRTVETHVERILGKLGVGSRTRAIAKAIRMRLVRVEDFD